MTAELQALKHFHFPALIEPRGPGALPASEAVRLHFSDGAIDALTWLQIPASLRGISPTAHVTLLEVPQAVERYLMVDCRHDAHLQLADFLHEGLCPVPGVIAQTKALVLSMRNAPLRMMLIDALTSTSAIGGFWSAPASLNDHHAYDGGLAHHSLEVATMVSSSTALDVADREIGTALALLHDYGKIWCYKGGSYTPEHKRGHVRVGLEKLEPHLLELGRGCPGSASALRELLGGSSQRKDRRYPLAIGRIVHAFDQMSCERTRRDPDPWDIPF